VAGEVMLFTPMRDPAGSHVRPWARILSSRQMHTSAARYQRPGPRDRHARSTQTTALSNR